MQTSEHSYANASQVFVLLLRVRRGLLRLAVGTALVVGALVMLSPRWWRADGSFVAQTPRLPGSLAAISGAASRLGISLPVSDASYPPQFYMSLMRSRAILDQLVEYPLDHDGDPLTAPQTLVDLLDERGDSRETRRDRTRRHLNEEMLGTGVDLKSGLVTFSIRSRNPRLAANLAEELLNAVVRFNEDRRQSQAGAERRFTEQRRAEVRNELREAEDRLAHFLQRNRDYRNAPMLVFEFDRLSREVALRQQIFTALSEAFEQARIEEVRDTPILTVVDAPSLPATPERRHLLIKVIVAFIVGLSVGVVTVLSRAALGLDAPASTATPGELSTLLSDAVRDLRRPWRLLLG